MTGYKGINRNMINHGIVFEVGQTYYFDGEIQLCMNGFHFCEKLINVFPYHPRREKNRYFEVEVSGDIITSLNGDKSVASEITILRELSDIEVNHWAYGSGTGDGTSSPNKWYNPVYGGEGGTMYVYGGFGYYFINGDYRMDYRKNEHVLYEARRSVSLLNFLGSTTTYVRDMVDKPTEIEVNGEIIKVKYGDYVYTRSGNMFGYGLDLDDTKYWFVLKDKLLGTRGHGDGHMSQQDGNGGSNTVYGYTNNYEGLGTNIQNVALFDWLIIEEVNV